MNFSKEVSAYIRASTNQQQLTLEFQKRANIEAAKNLGIILKEENIFTDAGVSGFTTPMEQRKNLQAVLKKAKKGEVSQLIVFKRDRLTRRAREYLKIAHSLQVHGVQIIFSDPAEHPFTTDYGWMVECVFAALLQKECEGIREKVILGLKTSHSMGLWTGGQPGFGFQYDKNSKELKVIREEAAAVKQIIHLLADGKSPQKIAQLLNEQNTLWASRNGKTGKWTTAKIKQIGSNPLFLGISERFGEKVHLKDQKPIVDSRIWQQAQETLEKYTPASRSKSSKKKAALLEGLVCCAQNYETTFRVRKLGKKYKYCCPDSNCTQDCPSKRININELESMVFSHCSHWFSSLDNRVLEKKTGLVLQNRLHEIETKINTLNSKNERLAKEISRHSDNYCRETHEFKKRQLDSKIMKLHEQKTEIEEKMSHFNTAQSELYALGQRQDKVLPILKDWEKSFASLNFNEQKSVYNQIIKFILIHPFRIEVLTNDTEILGVAD